MGLGKLGVGAAIHGMVSVVVLRIGLAEETKNEGSHNR